MEIDNVKLWFARDQNNEIITISDINENNKHNKYICPMCSSNLIPKAIKSKQITSHFVHIDASKCNSETMIHFWFKNKFLQCGDKFSIVSDKERQYICKEVLVEQSYIINGKTYKPDITVITECNKTIYFEMKYSNKKQAKDYIDIWLELKNIVIEIDIKKLINRDKIPTFTALFYNGKCFNIKKNDLYYNIIGRYKEEKCQEKLMKY
jgi:competence CoiA-like predicted nuclease